MKICLLAKYDDISASTRQRFLLYKPFLEEVGIEIVFRPLLSKNYLQNERCKISQWIVKSCTKKYATNCENKFQNFGASPFASVQIADLFWGSQKVFNPAL